MENPIKMDDLGVAWFLETPIYVFFTPPKPSPAIKKYHPQKNMLMELYGLRKNGYRESTFFDWWSGQNKKENHVFPMSFCCPWFWGWAITGSIPQFFWGQDPETNFCRGQNKPWKIQNQKKNPKAQSKNRKTSQNKTKSENFWVSLILCNMQNTKKETQHFTAKIQQPKNAFALFDTAGIAASNDRIKSNFKIQVQNAKIQNSENSNSQIQKNPKVPSSKSDLFFKIGTNGIWKKLKIGNGP